MICSKIHQTCRLPILNPSPHQPLFMLAATHSYLSPFFCWSLFVPTQLYWLALVLITAHSCPLLLICTCLCLFAGSCLSLLICICSVVLVPAQLCLSLLPDCACLGLFALIRLLFVLVWALPCSFML